MASILQPQPRQGALSPASPAASDYWSPQAPLPSVQPPGLRSAFSQEPPEAHWGEGGQRSGQWAQRAAGGMGSRLLFGVTWNHLRGPGFIL